MNKDIDQSIFEDMPVPKALAAMALPTILSQLTPRSTIWQMPFSSEKQTTHIK